MSTIYNIAKLSNKDLSKLVSEYISLEDIYDECDQCGRPVILHQDPGGECTRDSDEGLEVIAKNWRDLKKWLKLILKDIKSEREKKRSKMSILRR